MTTTVASPPRAWWEGRPYALLLIALSVVPLLWPPIPPLTDLLGHMGRYRVQLDIDSSPYLAQYFGFKWAILANLGVDLLVQALAPLIGLEPAVKLVVLAIPPITVAGLIGIVRETHGRVPATAAFALPLAWGYPYQFGFVNFALSMGLAMCAFALWLRLGRLGWRRLRMGLFVPIGIAIWFAHVFGWGVLGLLVFSAELVAYRRSGDGLIIAAIRAGLACWPLWPPILLMVAWRGQAAGTTGDWFYWRVKLGYLLSVLRERWRDWDIVGALLLHVLFVVAVVERRFRVDPVLALAAAVMAITFAVLPRILLGSAYADMRLAPTVVMCAVLAFNPSGFSHRGQAAWAIGATLFFLARVGTSTAALALYSAGWQAQEPALDHIARGSRVLALASMPCSREWHTARTEHLSSLATVRRDAFVNDQWVMPGAQLLTVHYDKGGRYTRDPSQIVRPTRRCRSRAESLLEPAVQSFPRDAFDYVWLIDVAPAKRPVDYPELIPLWFGERSGALYRVDHSVSGTPRSD
ncbi:hypothetical protein [Sphingomonas quercus]|uniref:Transmembrane protein n=1 Tax=Sphingomonas quercus TaxID=2842451 RepID=A0ABS6BGE1_9SPHN|nr:hypothetical protein [Sphingomonas quercus]MBU3077239.1 hypothetical protein [Sphingomonas quercus]